MLLGSMVGNNKGKHIHGDVQQLCDLIGRLKLVGDPHFDDENNFCGKRYLSSADQVQELSVSNWSRLPPADT